MEKSGFIRIYFKRLIASLTIFYLIINLITFISIREIKSNDLKISNQFTIFTNIDLNNMRTLVDLINLEGIDKALIEYSENKLDKRLLEQINWQFNYGDNTKLIQIRISKDNNNKNYINNLEKFKIFSNYFKNNMSNFFQKKMIEFQIQSNKEISTQNVRIDKLIEMLSLIIENDDIKNDEDEIVNNTLSYIKNDLVPNYVNELKKTVGKNDQNIFYFNIMFEKNNYLDEDKIKNTLYQKTIANFIIYLLVYSISYIMIIATLFFKKMNDSN